MSDMIPKVELTRRQFLKASAATVAVAAVGEQLFIGVKSSAMEATRVAASDEWKKHYCSSCIWPNCATEIHVRDGVAVALRGDVEAPFNLGTLCPRGAAQLANLYNPYRVKAPLKRTNQEKGVDVDPEWVEIGWEEALDLVAEKLKPIRESDPRKFVIKFGFSSQLHESAVPVALSASFGTPNAVMTAGPLCAVHYSPMLHHGTYVDKIDLGYCEYLVNFGKTLGGNFAMASGPGRALMDALERGMKLVNVDPRCGPEASKGEWVPIRPATDLAFGLAMIHVILHELDRFDVDAVKRRTNGPYLVGEDGDYVRDLGSGKPLIWDPVANTAMTFDDPAIQDFALEGEYTVHGTTARTAFSLLKAHAAQYTPEWAEPITTVPAATLRRITTEFVEAARIGSTIVIDDVTFPYRPVAVTAERGSVNHMGGRSFHYITGIINALVGAWDTPGTLCGLDAGPIWLQPGADGTIECPAGALPHYYHGEEFKYPPDNIELKEFYPISLGEPQVMARAIIDPEKYHINYRVEALMVHGANAIMNNANPDEVIESYLHVPFVFSIGYHFDEPTMLADVVLPESSNLERYQIFEGHPLQAAGSDTIGLYVTNYKYPVVEPIYDTMQVEDIVAEIAERVGFLYGPGGLNFMWNIFLGLPEEYHLALDRKYSWREVLDIRLRAKYGEDKGEEYFREHGWISNRLPLAQSYNYVYHPEARVEIYGRSMHDVANRLKANLSSAGIGVPGWDMDEYFHYYKPLPEWKETFLFQAPPEYDLFVVNWKISPRSIGIGAQDDNPWLREVSETLEHGGLHLLMNRETARAKGLRDGDEITVESQHKTTVTGILQTSELLHPEVIGVAGQAGHYSSQMHPAARRGVHYNRLISSNEGHFCPSAGGIDITARVRVDKA